jgi:type IV secretory pathway VirB10-like protein
VSPPPSAAGPPPGSEEAQVPPELPVTPPFWPGLDGLGLTQAIGGLALGLIALFSSYDHLTFAGRNIPIPQQWGIPLIAASVAIVFVDAELASGSRLRAADQRQSDGDRAEQRENEADRERNLAGEERQRANRERNRADQERNRADEARKRQAENTKCQNAALDLLRRSALLSARVQLDPSDTNRARLQTFLSLMITTTSEDPNL